LSDTFLGNRIGRSKGVQRNWHWHHIGAYQHRTCPAQCSGVPCVGYRTFQFPLSQCSQHYSLVQQAHFLHSVLTFIPPCTRTAIHGLDPALIGCLRICCVKGRGWGLEAAAAQPWRGSSGLFSGGDHGTANGQKIVCRCRGTVVQVIHSLSHAEDRSCLTP
jgi:hypothetical protein